MSKDLKQLIEQRQAIRNHLAWLDQEIDKAQTERVPSSPESIHHSLLTAPPIQPSPTLPSLPSEDVHLPILESSSPTFGKSQRQGCIALGILLAALLFFVLWILPGMIYD